MSSSTRYRKGWKQKGPLQGSIHWEGEESNPRILQLQLEQRRFRFRLPPPESVMRLTADGSCVDLRVCPDLE